MLGRQDMMPRPLHADKAENDRYERDIFNDMKIAIGLLKRFNEKLNQLHHDVIYKTRGLIA